MWNISVKTNQLVHALVNGFAIEGKLVKNYTNIEASRYRKGEYIGYPSNVGDVRPVHIRPSRTSHGRVRSWLMETRLNVPLKIFNTLDEASTFLAAGLPEWMDGATK